MTPPSPSTQEPCQATGTQGVGAFSRLATTERPVSHHCLPWWAQLGTFIERYNTGWLVERHDYFTPRVIRAKLQAAA